MRAGGEGTRAARRIAWTALVLLPSAGLAIGASPAAAASDPAASGVMVWGLVASPTSGEIFAAATHAGCKQACPVLLRSSDDGASWQTPAATGWAGQSPVLAASGGREYLVATDPNGLEVSSDAGDSFHVVRGPSGMLDVTGAAATSPRLLVSTSNGPQYVEPMPPVAGAASSLPTAPADNVVLSWNPAYPHQASGAPAAFGAGRDASSKAPVFLRCDAQLACTRVATISPAPDAARLFVSPHVDDDHTILAATRTALLRSTDGGATFLPVTVITPRPGTVITTVTDVTFTPDYDAHRHTGTALAAVLAVTQDSNHQGNTYGGIYASADGASWTQVGAGSALDSGAQAVAVTRSGRLVAAYIGFVPQKGVTGGLLCSADARTWQALCPAAASTGGTAMKALGSTVPSGHGGAAAAPPSGIADAPPTTSGSAAAAHSASAIAAAAHGGTSLGGRLVLPAVVIAGVLAVLSAVSALLRRRRRGAV